MPAFSFRRHGWGSVSEKSGKLNALVIWDPRKRMIAVQNMYEPKTRKPGGLLLFVARGTFALLLVACNATSSVPSSTLSASPSAELVAVANQAYIDTGAKAGVLEFALTGTGPVQTITSGPAGGVPYFLAADAAGNLYVMGAINGYASFSIAEYAPGTSTPSRTLLGVVRPTAMVSDPSGNLFVADTGVSTSGAILEYAPQATMPSAKIVSGIHAPQVVAEDDAADLYVLNVFGTSSNCKDTIIEYAHGASTPSRKLALKGCRFRSNAMAVDAPRSRLYVVTGDGQQVAVYDKSGTRPVRILKDGIDYAYALAVDHQGYLYVANAGSPYTSYGDLTVAIFAPSGLDPQRTIHVRNGIGSCSGPVAVDAQRHPYVIDCYFAFHRTADTVEYSPNGKRLRALHGLGDNAVAVTIIP